MLLSGVPDSGRISVESSGLQGRWHRYCRINGSGGAGKCVSATRRVLQGNSVARIRRGVPITLYAALGPEFSLLGVLLAALAAAISLARPGLTRALPRLSSLRPEQRKSPAGLAFRLLARRDRHKRGSFCYLLPSARTCKRASPVSVLRAFFRSIKAVFVSVQWCWCGCSGFEVDFVGRAGRRSC